MLDLINTRVLSLLEAFAKAFERGKPFRHVVIDDFLDPTFCHQLRAEFPPFDPQRAINEQGEVGKKATFENVRQLGSSYRRVDALFRAPEFLELMSRITGIPDLLYDPDYVGGGTHENLDGQDLDPHVDFNYHPTCGWHRRLNLLLFLNAEWNEEWGGSVEFCEDPWAPPEQNHPKGILPLFNRCVVFETTERSWHGFRRIQLPPERRALSRRSIAVYLYTKERSAEELAAPHTTIYVERPLPDQYKAGLLLTEADASELRRLVGRRDQHLKRLYARELEFSATIQRLTVQLAQARGLLSQRLPLQGFVEQVGEAVGVFEDLWVSPEWQFRIRNRYPTKRLGIEGFIPEQFPKKRVLTLSLGDHTFRETLGIGPFEWVIPVALPGGSDTGIRITSSVVWNPRHAGESTDDRDLAFRLRRVVVE